MAELFSGLATMTALLVCLFMLVMGLGILAAGQAFLCLREIAFNTRHAVPAEELQGGRTPYTALRIMVFLNNLLGILLIVGAALLFLIVLLVGE